MLPARHEAKQMRQQGVLWVGGHPLSHTTPFGYEGSCPMPDSPPLGDSETHKHNVILTQIAAVLRTSTSRIEVLILRVKVRGTSCMLVS